MMNLLINMKAEDFEPALSFLRNLKSCGANSAKNLKQIVLAIQGPEVSATEKVFSKAALDYTERARLLTAIGESGLEIKLVSLPSALGPVELIRTCSKFFAADSALLLLDIKVELPSLFFEDLQSALLAVEAGNTPWATLNPSRNLGGYSAVPYLGENFAFSNLATLENLAACCRRVFASVEEYPQLPDFDSRAVVLSKAFLRQLKNTTALPQGELSLGDIEAENSELPHLLLAGVFVGFSESPESSKSERSKDEAFFLEEHNHASARILQPYFELLSVITKPTVAFCLAGIRSHRAHERNSDPLNKYLRNLQQTAAAENCALIILRPFIIGTEQFVQIEIEGQPLAALSAATLLQLLKTLLTLKIFKVRSLSVHTLSAWQAEIMLGILSLLKPLVEEISVVSHEHFLLCQQSKLLYNDLSFCGAPEAKDYCNTCKYGSNLSEYRQMIRNILAQVDKLIFPSLEAEELFTRIYPDLKLKRFVHRLADASGFFSAKPLSSEIEVQLAGGPKEVYARLDSFSESVMLRDKR